MKSMFGAEGCFGEAIHTMLPASTFITDDGVVIAESLIEGADEWTDRGVELSPQSREQFKGSAHVKNQSLPPPIATMGGRRGRCLLTTAHRYIHTPGSRADKQAIAYLHTPLLRLNYTYPPRIPGPGVYKKIFPTL